MTHHTTPYQLRAAAAVPAGVRHVYRVQVRDAAGTLDLDADPDASPRVTFDEGWSPQVAVVGVVVPLPPASVRARLDPRTGTRLVVWAGYVYADGSEDVHQLADVLLTRCESSAPDNVVELEGQSDERLALDHALRVGRTYLAAELCRDVAPALIRAVVPGASVTVDPRLPWSPLGQDLVVAPGDSVWTAAVDAADRVDGWLYHDGAGWHLRRRPAAVSKSATVLGTGTGGTLVRARHTTDRDRFANAVLIRYANGGTSYAEATGPPFGVDVAPKRVQVVDRDTLPVGGSGNAARAILARTLSRGHAFTLSAVAAYWLRPGHTVTATLPTGPQERHLVSRVEYDLARGSMDLTTRLPVDAQLDGV